MNVLRQLTQSTLAARLVTIVLLAALAGLVTHTILNTVYGAPPPAVALPLSQPAQAPMPNWLAGGAVAAVAASSDLKLLGVIAQGSTGIALLQQSGKRAQPLRVGQSLPDGTQLKSVKGKTATVLINSETRTLTLEPATGGAGAIAVNNAAPTMAAPMPVMAAPDMAAQTALQMQQAQQVQQLQQAAAAQVPVEHATSEQNPASNLRKRLGGRP
jgi:hypothetical protein